MGRELEEIAFAADGVAEVCVLIGARNWDLVSVDLTCLYLVERRKRRLVRCVVYKLPTLKEENLPRISAAHMPSIHS